MSDDLALFDADRYGKSRARTRTQTPPHVIETVVVKADQIWRLVAKDQRGVVHAHAAGVVHKHKQSAMVSWCGVVGIPLSFTPGETVQGCAACFSRLGGAT